MKTTVEELKSYYVAQGGTEADVADVVTIPDMIAAITALGGGGGAGVLVANVKMTTIPGPSAQRSFSCDKTFDELQSAITSGVPVVALLESAGAGPSLYDVLASTYADFYGSSSVGVHIKCQNTFVESVAGGSTTVHAKELVFKADGTIEYNSYSKS